MTIALLSVAIWRIQVCACKGEGYDMLPFLDIAVQSHIQGMNGMVIHQVGELQKPLGPLEYSEGMYRFIGKSPMTGIVFVRIADPHPIAIMLNGEPIGSKLIGQQGGMYDWFVTGV